MNDNKAKKTQHLFDSLVVPLKFSYLHILSISIKESQEILHVFFTPEHTIISTLTGRHCGFYKMKRTDKYHVLLTRLVFL